MFLLELLDIPFNLIQLGVYYFLADNGYCKSLKFHVRFILQISLTNYFRKIKYHANILAVYCNNVTNSKSTKLNSNELTFMEKTAKYYTREI